MTTQELLDWIDANIKANGNRNITGPMLNDTIKKVMEWTMSQTTSTFDGTSSSGIVDQATWDSYTDVQKFQALVDFVSANVTLTP